jgi:hypothetical protein
LISKPAGEKGLSMAEDHDRPQNARYERYLEYRKDIITQKAESTKSYDQAILTLAGGALGISIAFIENLAARPPIRHDLLNLSWGSLTLALLSTLLSFFASQQALSRHVTIWDELYRNPDADKTNNWSRATAILNFLSVIFFIAGIVLLVWFASVNLPALRPLGETGE